MFPWNLLSLLRCPVDSGVLYRDQGDRACCDCGFRSEPVKDDGILDLGLGAPEHPEARRELDLRNTISVREPEKLSITPQDRAEMTPTINALQLRPTDILLELGCGSGRYTLELLDKCAGIVAVDFSRGALAKLSSRLPVGANVALIRVDIAQLKTAPAAFRVALSQLTSNLPSAKLRDCMYRVGANALASGGRFVFGAHYWGLAARRQGIDKDGYYPGESRIYRYYMTADEVRVEASRYFDSVGTHPVAIVLPGSYQFRIPMYPVSRICEKIPVVREFGTNLLCIARNARIRSLGFLWMVLESSDGVWGELLELI